MAQHRSKYADYIKGILILIVVLGHCIQNFDYATPGFWDDTLFKLIYSFHMPLFIGISGYFTFSSLQKTSAIQFIKNRILYLLVPIIIWGLIMSAIGLIASPAAMAHPIFYTYATIISSYWFIWAILIHSVVVSALKLFGVENNKYVLALVAVLSMLVPSFVNNVVLAFTKDMFPFFVMGYMLTNVDMHKLYMVCKKYILAIIGVCICCQYVWYKELFIYYSPSDIYHLDVVAIRTFTAIVMSATFLTLSYFIYEHSQKGKVFDLLAQLGTETLGIYLVQGVLFFSFYCNYHINSDSPLYSIFFLIPAIVMTFSIYYLFRFIEKSKILGLLLLGKKIKKNGLS